MAGELLIILATLIWVSKSVKCGINGGKNFIPFFFLRRIFESIGMISSDKFPMSTFDLIGGRCLFQTKTLIEIIGLPIDFGFGGGKETEERRARMLKYGQKRH
jgi:hypothetical protein